MIREAASNKGAICAEILATLPHWFGLPESNAAYARDVECLPMFLAEEGETTQGFIALRRSTPHAFDIHVLGVRPELHRKGVGRALVERAEAFARDAGVRFLTVKTRSSSRPDWGYDRTRAFYEAMGFVAIKEFPLLWNAENPAVMMPRVLG